MEIYLNDIQFSNKFFIFKIRNDFNEDFLVIHIKQLEAFVIQKYYFFEIELINFIITIYNLINYTVNRFYNFGKVKIEIDMVYEKQLV